MDTANTPAQGTGAMTLEQGVAAMKSKLAARGATVEDIAGPAPVLDPNDEAELIEDGQGGEVTTEAADTENTEAVSADESAEAKEETAPDTRPVILPDGSEITVEEARKGYLRQADFTRKTQDMAKERDALQRHGTNLTSWAKGALADFEAVVGTEPTTAQMLALRQQDPQKHAEVQAYWNDINRIRSERRKEISDMEGRSLQARKAKAWQALSEGTYDPKWKDPKVLSAAIDGVEKYMTDRGYTDEFISGMDNHLLIEDIEDARKYRELQKAKPKAALAVQGKPKPFTPGAKSVASPQSETIRLAQEAFTKNPSVENAAALMRAKARR